MSWSVEILQPCPESYKLIVRARPSISINDSALTMNEGTSLVQRLSLISLYSVLLLFLSLLLLFGKLSHQTGSVS